MAMNNNTKFEGKLTFHFKTDMRNLTNFDSYCQQDSLLLTGPGIFPQVYHRTPCAAVPKGV